jgi:hypothetical protein
MRKIFRNKGLDVSKQAVALPFWERKLVPRASGPGCQRASVLQPFSNS